MTILLYVKVHTITSQCTCLHIKVHARIMFTLLCMRYWCVSTVHWTLTWTAWSLMCVYCLLCMCIHKRAGPPKWVSTSFFTWKNWSFSCAPGRYWTLDLWLSSSMISPLSHPTTMCTSVHWTVPFTLQKHDNFLWMVSVFSVIQLSMLVFSVGFFTRPLGGDVASGSVKL